MRPILLLLCVLFPTHTHAQTETFEELFEKGKAEFKKEFEQQDYAAAVNYLEKAVKLKPDNSEAHYFLGYAYSRYNAKHGGDITKMSLVKTQLCSSEFETVNKLSPKYTGEYIVLDPYSKISSEWGSLSMSYMYQNKTDSAIWALKEGKKRGGFGDFFLAQNKIVLDLCSPNSILISSGDNFTFALWYLQLAEGYRKDVSVVDVALINTNWYIHYLNSNKIAEFDLPEAVLDTIEYCYWRDTTITIKNFTWTVKPSYEKNYVLRGDRVFLSLLKKNEFKREVFFTAFFDDAQRLSLENNLLPKILVDKLNNDYKPAWDKYHYKPQIKKVLGLMPLINKNSREETSFSNYMRYELYTKIGAALEGGDKKFAVELVQLMDEYLPIKDYPFGDDQTKEYDVWVRGQL